jgi:cyclohexyl-isocyanide hydratase
VIVVPGGPGQQGLMDDDVALDFLRTQAKHAAYTTSVCTGSLVLGAIPVKERVVIDGNVVTGAGVASGIDFALALAAILEGEQVAREIQLQIEYDPAPPFHSGSPETASPETLATLRSRLAKLNEERRAKALRAAEKLGIGRGGG